MPAPLRFPVHPPLKWIQHRVQTTQEPLVLGPDHYNHFRENDDRRSWLEVTQQRTERLEDKRHTRVRRAAGGPGPRPDAVHGDRRRSVSPLASQLQSTDGRSDKVRSQRPAEPPAWTTAGRNGFGKVYSRLLVLPNRTGR